MRKILAALSLVTVACGDLKEDSLLDYATFTPGRETMREWSAFTTIERRGCVLPAELYTYIGVPVPADQSIFVRESIEKAVAAWTATLNQNQFWRCKTNAVRWGEAGPGTVQFYLDPSINRAYTLVGQNQVYLPLASTVRSDPFAERVILHEMGHVFGLADTYSQPGYQQPIGQPQGIMNQLFYVEGLTEDDKAGANAFYEYINGRAPFCTNGYVVGGAFENPNRIAFCVPQF